MTDIKIPKYNKVSIGLLIKRDDRFKEVSVKQFFSAIGHIGVTIYHDDRLKEESGIESYHISNDDVQYLRDFGVKTRMVGYVYQSKYYIHRHFNSIIHGMRDDIEKYDLDVIRYNITLSNIVVESKPITPHGI